MASLSFLSFVRKLTRDSKQSYPANTSLSRPLVYALVDRPLPPTMPLGNLPFVILVAGRANKIKYILRTVSSYVLPARWFAGPRSTRPTPAHLEPESSEPLVSQSDRRQPGPMSMYTSDPIPNPLPFNPRTIQRVTPRKLIQRPRVFDRLGNEVLRPMNLQPLHPRAPLASTLDPPRGQFVPFDSTDFAGPSASSSPRDVSPSGLLRGALLDSDYIRQSRLSSYTDFFDDVPAPKSALAKHFTPRPALHASPATDSLTIRRPLLQSPSPLDPLLSQESVGTLRRRSNSILPSTAISNWKPTPGVAPDWPSPQTSSPIRGPCAKSAFAGPNVSYPSRLDTINPADGRFEDIPSLVSFITDVEHLVESPVSFKQSVYERNPPFNGNIDFLAQPTIVDAPEPALKDHHNSEQAKVASPTKEDTVSTPPPPEGPVRNESHEEGCILSSAQNDFFNAAIHADHGCPLLQLENNDCTFIFPNGLQIFIDGFPVIPFSPSTPPPNVKSTLSDKQDGGIPTLPIIYTDEASVKVDEIIEVPTSTKDAPEAVEDMLSIQAPSTLPQTIIVEEALDYDGAVNGMFSVISQN